MRSTTSTILCVVLVLAIQAGARNLYVATNGSNSNPGTITHPWHTIAYAVSAASGIHAGDTLIVRNGNYPESVFPEVSGTSTQPIILRRLKGESVSLDPGKIRFDSGVNYWKIWGFSFLHSGSSGVEITGTHASNSLYFLNCTMSHNREDGFYLSGAFGGLTIRNCDIQFNGEVAGQPQADEGHGIVVYGGGPAKLIIKNCFIANNWHKGLAFGSEMQFSGDGSEVDSNIVMNNYESGIDFAPDNSFVRHNYISHNGLRDTEEGEFGDKGFMTMPYCRHTTVAFNVIRSSGGSEIAPLGDQDYYYNNTLYKDTYYTAVPGNFMQGCMTFYDSAFPNSVWRNNIFCNVISQVNNHWCIIAEDYTAYTSQVWSNNLYWSPNSISPPPNNKPFKLYNASGPGGNLKTLAEVQATWPTEESNSIYVTPGFVSAVDSNFSLQSNSAAIDAGYNVGFPYLGQAPDIGAFEYGASNPNFPWRGLFQKSGAVMTLYGIGADEADMSVDPSTSQVSVNYGNGAANGSVLGRVSMDQNSPNPFNPTTTIRFSLPNDAFAKLTVYTVNGQLVKTLVQGDLQAGSHEVMFDGSSLASGVYLYRLEAGSFSQTQRMVLAK
jgi:hypothetical protein